MEETRPIKRSKELAPLSREHHDGLLFCWKLKHGLANGTPLPSIVNYTRWYWTNHIQPHFKDEETVLAKFLPADNALVRQMFSEHTRIRDLVLSLDEDPNANSIQELSASLNKHIRFEERQLFAYAEKVLTDEQLDEIFNHLPNELHCKTDWKDEFWLKKK